MLGVRHALDWPCHNSRLAHRWIYAKMNKRNDLQFRFILENGRQQINISSNRWMSIHLSLDTSCSDDCMGYKRNKKFGLNARNLDLGTRNPVIHSKVYFSICIVIVWSERRLSFYTVFFRIHNGKDKQERNAPLDICALKYCRNTFYLTKLLNFQMYFSSSRVCHCVFYQNFDDERQFIRMQFFFYLLANYSKASSNKRNKRQPLQ